MIKETKAKARAVIMPTEKVVHSQVCDYINLKYPNVYFTSDPSGARVTMGLRKEFERKRCDKYKVLDLIILHPAKGYNGLVIEIKRPGENIFKRDGISYVSEHVEQQARSITRLREMGYCACFGIGFDQCIEVIDGYMKG